MRDRLSSSSYEVSEQPLPVHQRLEQRFYHTCPVCLEKSFNFFECQFAYLPNGITESFLTSSWVIPEDQLRSSNWELRLRWWSTSGFLRSHRGDRNMAPIGLTLPVTMVLLFALDDFGQRWSTRACELENTGWGWLHFLLLPLPMSPVQLCHHFCHHYLMVAQKSMGLESEGQRGYMLFFFCGTIY